MTDPFNAPLRACRKKHLYACAMEVGPNIDVPAGCAGFRVDDVLDEHLPIEAEDCQHPRTLRSEVLAEAQKITAKDRNASYGEPEDNFQNIANIWNAQGYCFGSFMRGESARNLTAADVALMMAGMKLARLKHNPTHRDSWVDMAGYAACGYEVARRAEDRDVSRGPQ